MIEYLPATAGYKKTERAFPAEVLSDFVLNPDE